MQYILKIIVTFICLLSDQMFFFWGLRGRVHELWFFSQVQHFNPGIKGWPERLKWIKVTLLHDLLSSFSWTKLGDIINGLNCVASSRLLHLSGGLPGFLSLVEGEDGVESWFVPTSWWEIIGRNTEYYKTLRQFLPNRKTVFCAVPARSPDLGAGSLAVVRVLQDLAPDCRISVEPRLVPLPG